MVREGSAGGVSIAETRIVVEGQLKLGRYVTTYQDLSVGVAGLPLQVLRKYDSFDKTNGDFGIGWNSSSRTSESPRTGRSARAAGRCSAAAAA